MGLTWKVSEGRRAVCVCEEDVARHIEHAGRVVRAGVDQRAAVWRAMTVRG